jgi:hypothetical protein
LLVDDAKSSRSSVARLLLMRERERANKDDG